MHGYLMRVHACKQDALLPDLAGLRWADSCISLSPKSHRTPRTMSAVNGSLGGSTGSGGGAASAALLPPRLLARDARLAEERDERCEPATEPRSKRSLEEAPMANSLIGRVNDMFESWIGLLSGWSGVGVGVCVNLPPQRRRMRGEREEPHGC